MKTPQKKFIDPKKRSSASIRQPREVEGRRDIELLFEGMTMQDISKVVDKRGINTVIELQQKKFEQNNSNRISKNKRVKLTENEDFQEGQDDRIEDPLFEQKAISQALAFQKDLQE